MALRSTARALLRRLVPQPVLEWRQRRITARLRAKNQGRSAREIFSETYATAQWGGERGEFFSGRGSLPEVTAAYCATIRQYIAKHQLRSVLDLGCGDFEVGQRIQSPGVQYTGVDVVPALVERNRRLYGSESVRFECLDMIEDQLPTAELCLIRQVFQHLSNSQIAAVLSKLGGFDHVIVTEHYPANAETCTPNLDKPAGPDTRIFDGSGVFLDKPPFDRVCRLLLCTPAPATAKPGETLRTHLLGAERVVNQGG